MRTLTTMAVLACFFAANITLAEENAEVTPVDIAKDAGKAALYSVGTVGAAYSTGVILQPGSLDRRLLKEIVKNERLATEMDVQAARARARRDVLLLGRNPQGSADKLASALIMSDLEASNALARKSEARVVAKNARTIRNALPYGRGALAALPLLATAVNTAVAVEAYGDLGKDVIQFFAQPKKIDRLRREVNAIGSSDADSKGAAAAEAVVAP